MERCETCGNEYDKPMEIRLKGEDRGHLFDSFECAIHALAPHCDHCGCRILGHGIESDDAMYCCAACARVAGEKGARDRI